jgi:hypothetical protein
LSVKIVGAVSDEGSLEEIESIAKVFAYEQRMKQYTSLQKGTFQATMMNKDIAPKTTITMQKLSTSQPLHRSLVKGLC